MRRPGGFNNPAKYPKGGKKRRLGRGFRQMSKLGSDVALLKQAVSLFNVEYKFFDTEQAFTNIPLVTASTGTPLFMPLNNIAQGTGVTQREGSSIRVKSIQHHCTFDNTVASSTPCRVRMIFYLVLRPPVPYVPTIDTVLDRPVIGPIDAFRNLSFRSDIAILKDVVYRLDTSSPNDQQIMKFYKRTNFHTTWTTSDLTGLDITKNSLYCMVFTDQAQAVLPRVRCVTRIRYIDN